MPVTRSRQLGLLTLVLSLAGCATPFPSSNGSPPAATGEGNRLFQQTLRAHGGERLAQLQDLNVALDGDWKFLITRIQPLVTDHRYRVRSEERLQPTTGLYAADYQGPAGRKTVYRDPTQTRVYYDGEESLDVDVRQSTALTADSFALFLLGPLAHRLQGQSFERLPDQQERGRQYHRLHTVLQPGIGESERDELVLWIDAETQRTYRLHITLEGYRTTRGAHVDVTYLDYLTIDGFVLPTHFNERVRGPIAINAHRWWLTGLDLNRGWNPASVQSATWQGRAADAAQRRDVLPDR